MTAKPLDIPALTPELLARQTPAGFAWYASGGPSGVPTHHFGGKVWLYARHLQLVNEQFLFMLRGDFKRLALAWPPGNGKSSYTTLAVPAWLVCQFPHWRGMVITHTYDFAVEWGRKVRDLVKEFGPPLFGVKVRKDMERVDNWATPQGGGMISLGSQGGPIGRRCNWAIIDDPYGSWEDALSEVARQKVWEFITGTFRSRLEPDAFVLVSMARWHPQDLIGRLEAEQGQYWKIISLPARAETNDPLGREEGELLWPERWSAEALDEIRGEMTELSYMAQYQQRPVLPGGTLVKEAWIKRVSEVPEKFDQVIMSWDMAFKDTETSDYVSGVVLGRAGASVYVLEVVNERMDFAESAAAVKRMAASWPGPRAKLIEDKANGPAVVAYLRNSVEGLIPVNPQGGKTARVQSVLPLFEAGNVYVLDGQPWTNQFIAQLTAFPRSEHDDMVDALSQGLVYLYPTMREARTEELPEEAQPCEGRTLEAYRRHAKRAGMGQQNAPKWAWWM